jgi:hypothetical protein
MTSGSMYDPARETPPYGVGKYIFIFNLPGQALPLYCKLVLCSD